MSVELNHTVIPAKDKWVSAKFLADILNLEAGPEWGHFVPVKTANGVTLDFDTREKFRPGHYAFLVGGAEFDAAIALIRAASGTTPIRGAPSPARSTICTAVATGRFATFCRRSCVRAPVLRARRHRRRRARRARTGCDVHSMFSCGFIRLECAVMPQ